MLDPIPTSILLAAGVLLVSLILYTIFGGADFGSGIWTALAWGPRAGQQREALFNAIGPIWETNHVWLIFVVVTLFTVFPTGFSALFIALLIPLVIALVGINFRGAAFAFRHFGEQSPVRLPATAEIFSISSILTPFAMGMAVTATAAGHIRVADGQVLAGILSSWVTPFTVIGGLVGLAACAFLTPIYMTNRVQGQLQEDFRWYGMLAALALGGLTALEVPVALYDAPLFSDRLFAPVPLVLIALAVLQGLLTLFLLYVRRYFWAQIIAAGTVAVTLAAFGAALYPDLLIGQLSLVQAAAPHSTVITYLTVLPFGALVLAPSLWLLYRTFLPAR